jgi:hypothetical protein
VTTLTAAQVDAWRLARHHLLERAPHRRLVQVVSDMCGVQAQVMSAAELSIWARVADVRPEDVPDALWKRRRLVKTWMMRGTLHLLPAADLPLYVAAARTRQNHRSPAWLRYFEVTLEQMDAVVPAVGEALDGRRLTREELAEEIGARVSPVLRDKLLGGWGTLLKPAAYSGSLCFAPSRGRNVAFTRPASWLGRWEELDSGEALAETLRRYLRAYGPSTREDFAVWWGGAAAAAGRLIRSLTDELVEVEADGRRGWMLAKDAERARKLEPPDAVRLLPNFDVYTLAYRPRSTLVPDGVYDRVFRTAGWISPVVLVNGRIAGVWERKAERGRIELRVEPFVRLGKAVRRRVEEEAALIDAFRGDTARVVWSPR